MEVAARAKINLSLRVLGRRADGFHEIETLIAPLSLADGLSITPHPSHEFTCSTPDVPSDASNLVVRAIAAFEAASGKSFPLRVHLEKRIPHGAGLGGGSSDAATVLRWLNSHSTSPLGLDKLNAVAATIGSDLPAMLHSQPVWCRGRGEIVELATDIPSLPIVLFKAAFGVETPWAYKNWASSPEVCGVDYAPQGLDQLMLVNSLERPVFAKFVFLAVLKMWLISQPEVRAALMSGSGSTMFAVLHSPADAPNLIGRATEEVSDSLWTWSGFTIGSSETGMVSPPA